MINCDFNSYILWLDNIHHNKIGYVYNFKLKEDNHCRFLPRIGCGGSMIWILNPCGVHGSGSAWGRGPELRHPVHKRHQWTRLKIQQGSFETLERHPIGTLSYCKAAVRQFSIIGLDIWLCYCVLKILTMKFETKCIFDKSGGPHLIVVYVTVT